MSAVLVVLVVAIGLGYVLRRSRFPRATGAFRTRSSRDVGLPMIYGDGGHSGGDHRDDPGDSHGAGSDWSDSSDGGSDSGGADGGGGDGGGGGGSE